MKITRIAIHRVHVPLKNEPGWESETGNKSRDYNRLLEYHNLRVAVIKMILDK